MGNGYGFVIKWMAVTTGILMLNMYAQVISMFDKTGQYTVVSSVLGGLGGAGLAWWFWWTCQHDTTLK